jgi:hypothetical protein
VEFITRTLAWSLAGELLSFRSSREHHAEKDDPVQREGVFQSGGIAA